MLDIERIYRETFVARVEHHSNIGSTNDRATSCAAKPDQQLPLLIVADRQTAGRGRGTHRWWTGPGALAASLVVDGDMIGGGHGRPPLVALAVAVAVVDAVAPLLPGHDLGIHWPNDVMVNGRKIAGILIEALANGRHVIGIGLNTNNSLSDAPAELHPTAATLRDLCGHQVDQTELLVKLLQRLAHEFCLLRTQPEAIALRADGLCQQRGRTLACRWANRAVTGQCRGIAPDGALLLETAARSEPIYSGALSEQISDPLPTIRR